MRGYLGWVACLGLCFFAQVASSQERAGTWDVGLHVFDVRSETFNGNGGSSLVVDDQYGYGFTGAYNFTNRLAVGFDLSWISPDYTATRILEGSGQTDTIRAQMDVFNIHAKGIFNFLEGPLTPFVEAGLGWTYVDSNILDRPPTTGCWWDPWWGYICDTFFSTYSETRTSYTAGVGVRWDMLDGFMLKGTYGLLEVDTSSATEDAELDTLRIDFAWRF